MLRPAIGIDPFKYRKIIGKKLRYNRYKGDVVKFSDLK